VWDGGVRSCGCGVVLVLLLCVRPVSLDKYPPAYLPIYIPTYLYTYPPICPPCPPISLSLQPRSIHLPTYLSAYLYTYLSIYLPTYLSAYLYTYLSIYLATYLSTLPAYLSLSTAQKLLSENSLSSQGRSVCGRCSFGGLGCCSSCVCVCRCRRCCSLSVCVCVTC